MAGASEWEGDITLITDVRYLLPQYLSVPSAYDDLLQVGLHNNVGFL